MNEIEKCTDCGTRTNSITDPSSTLCLTCSVEKQAREVDKIADKRIYMGLKSNYDLTTMTNEEIKELIKNLTLILDVCKIVLRKRKSE